ncbi:hypothetical protein GB937_008752 [Aspergillus fischeri]|nr:hypothetical protein GB937_008752 [Aspergillus fischeri]
MTSADVALLAVYMQGRPNYRARRTSGGEPEIAMNHVAKWRNGARNDAFLIDLPFYRRAQRSAFSALLTTEEIYTHPKRKSNETHIKPTI